jgi:hypothetical protein
MKKYEAAKGVCAIKWIHGSPTDADEYGMILVEFWNAPTISVWNPLKPRLCISARLDAASWDYKEKKWRYLSEMVPGMAVIRRWTRLSTARATVPLHISDWS